MGIAERQIQLVADALHRILDALNLTPDQQVDAALVEAERQLFNTFTEIHNSGMHKLDKSVFQDLQYARKTSPNLSLLNQIKHVEQVSKSLEGGERVYASYRTLNSLSSAC